MHPRVRAEKIAIAHDNIFKASSVIGEKLGLIDELDKLNNYMDQKFAYADPGLASVYLAEALSNFMVSLAEIMPSVAMVTNTQLDDSELKDPPQANPILELQVDTPQADSILELQVDTPPDPASQTIEIDVSPKPKARVGR